MTLSKDYFDTAADEAGADRNAPRTPTDMRVRPAETEVGRLEREARAAYIAELQDRANAVTDPEISREMLALAGRVKNALPVMELFDRLGKIQQAKEDLPSTGLDAVQLRAGLDESAEQLRQANPQPPLLMELMERYEDRGPELNPAFYLAGDASESDRLSVAAAVSLLGLNAAEKGRAVKPLTQKQRIDKAVKAATASLDLQIFALRKQLADFRAEQERLGVRFE
jgi:hypothetical protein